MKKLSFFHTPTFSRTINYNKSYYKLQPKKWLPFPFFQKHYYIITFFTNSTFCFKIVYHHLTLSDTIDVWYFYPNFD